MGGALTADKRIPCPHCGTPIFEGAYKCRGCRKWLSMPPGSQHARQRPPRLGRSATLLMAAVVAVVAVLLAGNKSPVGDAPPLTPLTSSAKVPAAPHEPAPAALGPGTVGGDARAKRELDALAAEPQPWRSRQIKIDVHPLDLAFTSDGTGLFVSADDASLRQYDVESGRLLHMSSVPAQGDRIRVIAERYVAVVPLGHAAHIPVVDTENWDREPILLLVGRDPADIVALPGGHSVVAASRTGKRLSWWDLDTAQRIADIKLPHATRNLYLVRAHDRPYVAAMGMLSRGKRPVGAWLDLFDPAETPFGATRRSISVGRDPGDGAVSADGSSILFVDRVSNTASLLRVDSVSEAVSAPVGIGPRAAFLLNRDKHGVTIDATARTATVLSLPALDRVGTLMLHGEPRDGATSPDGETLFVSLGGTSWPPSGSGAVVISGDPPQVVATVDTGRGAARVAVSPDGRRAAVVNFLDRAITFIER